MNISNTQLDIDFARSQFPAFNDPLCKDWSFFENAGGSYVPNHVIKRLNEFMTSTKVQPYAEYPMSKIAGDNMDKATELFAQMINAKNKEIIRENGKDLGRIISVKSNFLLAMINIEIALNKIELKKTIETDDGLILEFVI